MPFRGTARTLTAERGGLMGMATTVDRLGSLGALDRLGEPLLRAVRAALPPGRARDALRGRWLGHALHPMLTDLPIGLWTGAIVLDQAGGRRAEPGADLLVAAGAVAAVPTALAGLADWSEASLDARRQGVVHALANVGALSLFVASLAARGSDRSRGKGLALLGGLSLAAGGYIGAHLTYTRGVSVSWRAATEPAGPPAG